jgi:hypothetical protein
MATFGERLSSVLGTNAGYDPSLRRSIQNAALFEAKRIIDHMEAQRAADDSLEHLRAFQRKYVFWELAKQVLDTTHLQPEERAQVLWRKMTTKEPLGPETAWKRVRTIEKELESLADAIRPLLQAGGRSEEQAIDEYIAQAFVSSHIYIQDRILFCWYQTCTLLTTVNPFSLLHLITSIGGFQQGQPSCSDSHVGIHSQPLSPLLCHVL